MKRRIIKQGHNTLTVTLPSKWARKLNMGAGDEIDILEKENTLILNTQAQKKSKSCEIDIRDFTIPLLWRYFQAAYRSGYGDIKILCDPAKKELEDAYHYYTTQFDYAKLGEKVSTKPSVAVMQEITSRFIGLEVVGSGKGYYLIKEMAEVSSKEFDPSLRRIFLVIKQLFERIIDAMQNNEIQDTNLCKELHTMDLNVDKFVDYCARILNKIDADFPENRKSLVFSSLYLLELIGDEFKYIGKHIAISDRSVKENVALAKMVQAHFEIYYNLYYAYSRDVAIEFGRADFEVYEKHFKTKDKIRGESRSIQKHLMHISKLTLALVELKIQMEF